MAKASLLSLTLERFKSYSQPTTVELAPLTVLLGRNNSGKSSIIQALLLLKQTLALPRPDVPLHLEGSVDALSLRELTSGWPEAGPDVSGPRISLRWSSTVDVGAALESAKRPDRATLAANTGIEWIGGQDSGARGVITELDLDFGETDSRTVIRTAALRSFEDARSSAPAHSFEFRRNDDGSYQCTWQGNLSRQLTVDWDHFLPLLLIDRRNVGPRDRERSWHNAFLLLFSQPLDDLKQLLGSFAYLGSMRTLPPTLYRPAAVPPEEIGVSGEYAAQMLHARRAEIIHYLPPVVAAGESELPGPVRARPLEAALNDVMTSLGVSTQLCLEDVREVGFRLLFGRASLQHVGRGLSYLLPVIELGLIADPLRFKTPAVDMPLDEYRRVCERVAHCALEEPEAHLHPKIQSQLAHWLVALALCQRQLIVETHSDHLVRRLRGLAARSASGSDLERWLLENIRLLHVEQSDGNSAVARMALTAEGGLESWPADFMDEATSEERRIYDASLDKTDPAPLLSPLDVEHDVGEEPDDEP